jgi:hypothetical protein
VVTPRFGVWLNRNFSEAVFSPLVYILTFLAGLEFIFHLTLAP